MVLLQRALYHVKQRHHPHWKIATILHEQHNYREKLLVPLGRPLAKRMYKQSIQRRIPFRTLPPHARHQLRDFPWYQSLTQNRFIYNSIFAL